MGRGPSSSKHSRSLFTSSTRKRIRAHLNLDLFDLWCSPCNWHVFNPFPLSFAYDWESLPRAIGNGMFTNVFKVIPRSSHWHDTKRGALRFLWLFRMQTTIGIWMLCGDGGVQVVSAEKLRYVCSKSNLSTIRKFTYGRFAKGMSYVDLISSQ